jgi:hypothetical protein
VIKVKIKNLKERERERNYFNTHLVMLIQKSFLEVGFFNHHSMFRMNLSLKALWIGTIELKGGKNYYAIFQ